MHVNTPRNMADARVGERITVTDIHHTGAMRKLLTELGLTKGAEIVCRLISPHGDMMMFELRGALLAMRISDLEKIEIA